MPVRPTAKARPVHSMEQLELRTLLSTVLVTSFGATPNDGNDDSFQIQSAINASQPGDTIFFPTGTYNINRQLDALPGNRTYTSGGDATLVGKTSDGEMLKVESDNVKITNLTFNGGGVLVDKPSGGMNQNILFDNDVFNLNTSGNNPNGITATSGLMNSVISNNLFTGYNAAFGIYGYNYNGLTISNNEFVNISAGIHIDVFTPSGNLLVQQNYITGVHGMGMEFQTQGAPANNLVFQDNWFENPVLSSNARSNTNSMAFSLPLDEGSNILIQRNVVIAPQKPDGIGDRIGFEVGGDNTIVRENYVNGINAVLAMTDGVGSASVTAQDNLFMNYAEGPQIVFPSSIRKLNLSNNGPGVQLDWDISRGRPGRNKLFGGTSIPGVGAGDLPGADPGTGTGSGVDPSIIPPTNLIATAISANRVDLTWQDNATGELGYQIERSTDGGQTWIQVGLVGFNTTSYSDVNLPPSTSLSYRVRAYSPAGESDYSNTASAKTLAGSGPATGSGGGGTTTNPPTNGGGGGTVAPPSNGGGGGAIIVPTPPPSQTPPRGTL